MLWQHRRVLLAWAVAEGGGGGELEPRWLGAEVVERERALAEAIESGDERAAVNARRHAQWCEGTRRSSSVEWPLRDIEL